MTYYKAVRPDGTSFHDRSFRWLPESGPVDDDRRPTRPPALLASTHPAT